MVFRACVRLSCACLLRVRACVISLCCDYCAYLLWFKCWLLCLCVFVFISYMLFLCVYTYVFDVLMVIHVMLCVGVVGFLNYVNDGMVLLMDGWIGIG